MNTEPIIAFLKETEKFKTCERTCQTTSPGRAESDAEHSWHLALFLLLLEDEFKGLNFNRLLKMALFHDLPEIYAGDTNPYRDDTSGKEDEEQKAAGKLFALLPPDKAGEFAALFNEYAEQKTLESMVVKSADKLMPLIQNLCTNPNHSSYRKLDVQYHEVLGYMDQYFPGGVLKEIYLRLLAEAREQGVFAET